MFVIVQKLFNFYGNHRWTKFSRSKNSCRFNQTGLITDRRRSALS